MTAATLPKLDRWLSPPPRTAPVRLVGWRHRAHVNDGWRAVIVDAGWHTWPALLDFIRCEAGSGLALVLPAGDRPGEYAEAAQRYVGGRVVGGADDRPRGRHRGGRGRHTGEYQYG